MTETSFSQVNPAFVPAAVVDEVVVEEFGNDEPVAVYEEPVVEDDPQPVDEPVDDPEDPVDSDDPVLDTTFLDDEE
jgi:hypothetical protein